MLQGITLLLFGVGILLLLIPDKSSRLLAGRNTETGLLFGQSIEKLELDSAFFSRRKTLREQVLAEKRGKKKKSVVERIAEIRRNLFTAGKGALWEMLVIVCPISAALGAGAAIALKNWFLLPVTVCAGPVLLYLFADAEANRFKEKMRKETENALSLVSNAYYRSEDLIGAVQESLPYIREPALTLFLEFNQEVTLFSADIKAAVRHLREKWDNRLFREWCDTLLRAGDNRAMKEALLPIVTEMAEMRVIQEEIRRGLVAAKKEYWGMGALVLGSFPLLWLINKDWFRGLTESVSGKLVIALVMALLLFTLLRVDRLTDPEAIQ